MCFMLHVEFICCITADDRRLEPSGALGVPQRVCVRRFGCKRSCRGRRRQEPAEESSYVLPATSQALCPTSACLILVRLRHDQASASNTYNPPTSKMQSVQRLTHLFISLTRLIPLTHLLPHALCMQGNMLSVSAFMANPN